MVGYLSNGGNANGLIIKVAITFDWQGRGGEGTVINAKFGPVGLTREPPRADGVIGHGRGGWDLDLGQVQLAAARTATRWSWRGR